MKTLKEAWEDVIAGVVVRHPDVETSVRLEIQTGYQRLPGRIHFMMSNVPDSTYHKRRISGEFDYSEELPDKWPGEEMAQKLIAAWWVIYMTHEALELVTRKGSKPEPKDTDLRPFGWGDEHSPFPGKDRIMNPHDDFLPDHLTKQMHNPPGPQILSVLYGPAIAKERWDDAIAKHADEVTYPAPEPLPWNY